MSGQVNALHPAECHQEHHVRQRLARLAAGEHVRPAVGECLTPFENLDASIGERYAMLGASLHPTRGNRPRLRIGTVPFHWSCRRTAPTALPVRCAMPMVAV